MITPTTMPMARRSVVVLRLRPLEVGHRDVGGRQSTAALTWAGSPPLAGDLPVQRPLAREHVERALQVGVEVLLDHGA